MRSKSAAWLLLVAVLCGCGHRYPEISPQAYEVARTVYNVCNQQRAEQLAALKSLIDARHASQQLTLREADVLRGIVAYAEQGDWAKARNETRHLLADQVDRRS